MEFLNAVTGQTVTAAPWQAALAVGSHYLIITPDLTIIGELVEATDDAGFFWSRAYSEACTLGELGLMCVADAHAPLSAEAFVALLDAIQDHR